MTRPAQPPPASTFGEAETTGARPTQRFSSDRPRPSPCLVARRYLQEGKPQQAVSVLEQELAAGEETRELQYWLGRAAFQLGDHARAQRALFRASALSPGDSEARRWLARVLLRRGNAVAAMRVLSRTSRPPAPHAIHELGDEEGFGGELSPEPPTASWTTSRRRSERK